MRQGCLLAEDSPSNLLTSFGTNSLEDVFLILSQKQEAGVADFVGSEYISMVSKNSSSNSINSGGDFSSTANVRQQNAKITTAVYFLKMFSSRSNNTNKTEKEISAWALEGYRLKALLFKNWIQFFRNLR